MFRGRGKTTGKKRATWWRQRYHRKEKQTVLAGVAPKAATNGAKKGGRETLPKTPRDHAKGDGGGKIIKK